jgi:hypothetical protein
MVDGELWDLDRPLENSCKLELLVFNHSEGSHAPSVMTQGYQAGSHKSSQEGLLAFERAYSR